MALSVNNNIAALNTYRNLTSTQTTLSKSLEKLSSGYRINRAADDAAGLAISEGLRSQVNGLTQASRNAQDGISVVQTAEGALNESTSILQRMRTLSVQAASSGSLSTDAKSNIQAEVSQLKDELTRIAKTTTFNGQNLLDGSGSTLKFQVGANVGESLSVNFGADMTASGLGLAGVDVTLATAAGALAGARTTTAAASTSGVVTVASSTDYSKAEAFDSLNGTVTVNGKSLDLSTVKFADGATAAQRTTAVQNALNSALGTGAVTVANTTTGLTFTGAAPASGASAADIAAKEVTFTSATGADGAITALDHAIQTVSSSRANLGAVQNRLEHTIANLNVSVENLTASESRIRDTDMASEMVKFTSSQILAQAGTAMLAQAKNLPQGVLSLLQN